jgi:hypothetical protein
MPILAKLKVLKPSGGDFLQRALIDTGNNFRSLISKEILDDNKITFTPTQLNALSVDLKPVNIIGHVHLQFNFEGSDQLFEETFYIPENTSKIINLGYEFLKTNSINLLLDRFAFELSSGELIPIESGPAKWMWLYLPQYQKWELVRKWQRVAGTSFISTFCSK